MAAARKGGGWGGTGHRRDHGPAGTWGTVRAGPTTGTATQPHPPRCRGRPPAPRGGCQTQSLGGNTSLRSDTSERSCPISASTPAPQPGSPPDSFKPRADDGRQGRPRPWVSRAQALAKPGLASGTPTRGGVRGGGQGGPAPGATFTAAATTAPASAALRPPFPPPSPPPPPAHSAELAQQDQEHQRHRGGGQHQNGSLGIKEPPNVPNQPGKGKPETRGGNCQPPPHRMDDPRPPHPSLRSQLSAFPSETPSPEQKA